MTVNKGQSLFAIRLKLIDPEQSLLYFAADTSLPDPDRQMLTQMRADLGGMQSFLDSLSRRLTEEVH